jgi:hypothetical protein
MWLWEQRKKENRGCFKIEKAHSGRLSGPVFKSPPQTVEEKILRVRCPDVTLKHLSKPLWHSWWIKSCWSITTKTKSGRWRCCLLLLLDGILECTVGRDFWLVFCKVKRYDSLVDPIRYSSTKHSFLTLY